MNLPGYRPDPPQARPEQINQIAAAIKLAKRPIIYAGGGIITSEPAMHLRTLVKKTGIPVATDRAWAGRFPAPTNFSPAHAGHARHGLRELRGQRGRPAARAWACGSTTA